MSKWIKKLFHRCKMKTVDMPHSNRKGEIWIQECVCGKQQEVMFNRNGDCVSIKPKQR